MGRNAHFFIEYRHHPERRRDYEIWQDWIRGELCWKVSDDLLAALSGMGKREGFQELIPARGFPERDAGGECFVAMCVRVVEDVDHDPRIQVDRNFLRSEVRPDWKLVKRGNGDYVWWPGISHGHTHLTLEEIHQCLAHAGLEVGKTDIFFQAVMATMEKLAEGYETRLVLWHDL